MPCRINDILVSGIATVKNVYASSLFVKKVYICIVFQYLNIMKKSLYFICFLPLMVFLVRSGHSVY